MQQQLLLQALLASQRLALWVQRRLRMLLRLQHLLQQFLQMQQFTASRAQSSRRSWCYCRRSSTSRSRWSTHSA
jgi:hypothetical protein